MTKKKKSMGSGLEKLIPSVADYLDDDNFEETEQAVVEVSGKPLQVKISEIYNNPDQPRKNFPEEELTKLVNSIKDNGILEPLVVFKKDDGYQLIAGHRRLKAAELANLVTVPIIIRERQGNVSENLDLALIENIIRQDLNPIEEAESLEKLEKHYKKDVISIGKLVGKDSSTVKNSIRLLKLPEPVKQDIREGRLSSGHGKVLLSLEDNEEQLLKCRADILTKSLTVRQTENLVKKITSKDRKKSITREKEEMVAYYDSLAKTISDALDGLKVEIVYEGRKKKIIINYNSIDNIDSFLSKLNITVPS
jgi:ParB family chromosome partitioning protein